MNVSTNCIRSERSLDTPTHITRDTRIARGWDYLFDDKCYWEIKHIDKRRDDIQHSYLGTTGLFIVIGRFDRKVALLISVINK